MTEEYTCSICQVPHRGYGNNADPINNGRCCDTCNELVIIARINRLALRQRQKQSKPSVRL